MDVLQNDSDDSTSDQHLIGEHGMVWCSLKAGRKLGDEWISNDRSISMR